MRNRMIAAAAAFFAVMALLAGQAHAGTDNTEAKAPAATSTIKDMVAGMVRIFPRAEGPVLTSGDKSVKVGIGSKQGLTPGHTVYLVRKGSPIIHPVTKVVLGNKDIDLAVGVAAEVSENESTVEITELYATLVAEGDTARLPTERDKLLVTVAGKDYNELVLDEVLRELRASGRFSISGPSEINPARLAEEGFLEGLARESGSPLVLTVSTEPTTGQGVTGVELRLMTDAAETKYVSSETVEAQYDVFSEDVMGVSLVTGERRDFFRMEDLPYRGVHMDVGDVTGDGKPVIIVSNGRDIYLYRFVEGVLRMLWTYRGITGDEHLAVQAADLNGNGFDEIYVTNFQRGRMASFVIEYDGETYYKTYGPSPMLFRVLDMPDGKQRLLTTTLGANSPYSGRINEYAWKDGKLVKVGDAGLPDAIKDPYGFVIADIVPEKDKLVQEPTENGAEPEPEPEIIWVDDSDYVQILDIDDGERIWESPERYGGYDNFFETDKADNILPNVDPRGKVKGRLIVREGAGGETNIIITKNIALTYLTRRFRGYSGAEIYAFGWDGSGLVERWSVKHIEGYLADINVGPIYEPRRTDILILTEPTFKLEKRSRKLPLGSVRSFTEMFEDSSTLMLYKIPQR